MRAPTGSVVSAPGPPAGRGVSGAASRIEGIDGLRACAALLVLTYHAARFPNATSSGTLAPLLSELKAGVTVFFVISGLVLYLPFARAIGSGISLPDWRQYAVRRAIRILPAYWTVLAVLSLAGQLNGGGITDTWRYIGFVQIYDFSTLLQGLSVAWSLDVEVTFYLALPLVALFAAWLTVRFAHSRFAPQMVLVAVIGVGSLLLRLVLATSPLAPVGQNHLLIATALPGMADWFALGMGLAVFRAAIECGARVPRQLLVLAGRPVVCWLIAAALYLAAVPVQGGDLFLAAYGLLPHLIIGLAAMFLVLPVLSPTTDPKRRGVMPFLRCGLLTWLGMISYGIYLWHVPFLRVIYTAEGQPQGLLGFVGLLMPTAVGAVCLGAASWYLIERPSHRLHRFGAVRLPRGLRRAVGETP
jgi:peptidoglycan/LPS O-acetylase OafA/YrhL